MRDRKLGNVLAMIASCGGFAFGSLCHADDTSRATALARNCTTCHGPEAQGSLSIPKIRGLDKQDIVESMKGFRSGEERQTIMGRIAKGYSDADIELLAAYFFSMK